MKTLKKAAVIGAVAYGGYQLGKLSSGYSHWGWGHSHGYGFNDWNRWRGMDGFLCRNTEDCSWIDRQLYCQDYELDFQPSVSNFILLMAMNNRNDNLFFTLAEKIFFIEQC